LSVVRCDATETEDHRIDFTSRGVDQCPTLLAPLDDGRDADGSAPGPAQPTPTTENPYPPWKPSIIQDAKVFTARIGPAGGKRGYTGITGTVFTSMEYSSRSYIRLHIFYINVTIAFFIEDFHYSSSCFELHSFLCSRGRKLGLLSAFIRSTKRRYSFRKDCIGL